MYALAFDCWTLRLNQHHHQYSASYGATRGALTAIRLAIWPSRVELADQSRMRDLHQAQFKLGFFGHLRLIPGRIEDEIDFDLRDARETAHGLFHPAHHLACDWAAWRG